MAVVKLPSISHCMEKHWARLGYLDLNLALDQVLSHCAGGRQLTYSISFQFPPDLYSWVESFVFPLLGVNCVFDERCM